MDVPRGEVRLHPRRRLLWRTIGGGRAVAASPEPPPRFLENAGPSPVGAWVGVSSGQHHSRRQ